MMRCHSTKELPGYGEEHSNQKGHSFSSRLCLITPQCCLQGRLQEETAEPEEVKEGASSRAHDQSGTKAIQSLVTLLKVSMIGDEKYRPFFSALLLSYLRTFHFSF